MSHLLLALDTATDITTVGLAYFGDGRMDLVASAVVDAPRAAMSRVLVATSSLLAARNLGPSDIEGVIVGRGPGSFTGVRIGVASAKGIAHGLNVPLWGVGTLDAIAWTFAETETLLGVVGDAMRGEVYPALFRCGEGRAFRLTQDRVMPPEAVVAEWASIDEPLLLAGNGLHKYREVLSRGLGARGDDAAAARAAASETAAHSARVRLAPENLWPPQAAGLFRAFASALEEGEAGTGDPGLLLPVYTRLSDAEEAESQRRGRAVQIPGSGVAGSAHPPTSGGGVV